MQSKFDFMRSHEEEEIERLAMGFLSFVISGKKIEQEKNYKPKIIKREAVDFVCNFYAIGEDKWRFMGKSLRLSL